MYELDKEFIPLYRKFLNPPWIPLKRVCSCRCGLATLWTGRAHVYVLDELLCVTRLSSAKPSGLSTISNLWTTILTICTFRLIISAYDGWSCFLWGEERMLFSWVNCTHFSWVTTIELVTTIQMHGQLENNVNWKLKAPTEIELAEFATLNMFNFSVRV